MRRFICPCSVLLLCLVLFASCGAQPPKEETRSSTLLQTKGISSAHILARAQNEGRLDTLGMLDNWANYGGIWEDLRVLYGIRQENREFGSADVIKEFEAGRGDIGDVGYEYGKIAEARNLTLKYKTPYWDEIPAWAKDRDGDWMVAYTGTLAFAIREDLASSPPRGWSELADSGCKVAINSPLTDTIGQYVVYAAALAMGGSAGNTAPGIAYFKHLALQGRLVSDCITCEDFLASGAAVQPLWDFTALTYRDHLDALSTPIKLNVLIPRDSSVTVGYATIISRRALHPAAAMAAREYIMSDSGQLNLAQGYATPIRPVSMPRELEKRRIPANEYSEAMIASALTYKPETARAIAAAWQKEVEPLLRAAGGGTK